MTTRRSRPGRRGKGAPRNAGLLYAASCERCGRTLQPGTQAIRSLTRDGWLCMTCATENI